MAESAHASGYDVIAADLFGDQDLRASARQVAVIPARDYPNLFESIAAQFPGLPIAYTGGLENHPELLQRLARISPLWGNSADVCSKIRALECLAHLVRQAPLQFPETIFDAAHANPRQHWLRKPKRSTGGAKISPWTGEPLAPDEYLQRFLPGQPHSTLFLLGSSETYLVGSARQILARDVTSTDAFAFVGAIAPVPLPTPLVNNLHQLGTLLQQLGLRGFVGVDWIMHQDNAWVIEVNPRYPATAELYEKSLGQSLFETHRQCFTNEPLSLPLSPPQKLWGKSILFAPSAATLKTPPDPNRYVVADRPLFPIEVAPGEPILTLFATGASVPDVQSQLHNARANFLADYFPPSEPSPATS